MKSLVTDSSNLWISHCSVYTVERQSYTVSASLLISLIPDTQKLLLSKAEEQYIYIHIHSDDSIMTRYASAFSFIVAFFPNSTVICIWYTQINTRIMCISPCFTVNLTAYSFLTILPVFNRICRQFLSILKSQYKLWMNPIYPKFWHLFQWLI
mgnify:FL=1